ncbi:uncharacterized protein LOC143242706 [Tachypleus tridentatus]|uniref:uncharacterized protein LOC143242706 n=2 Tax=Tachypleus tridentatus TaxID=6853 RepID=UPI003FD5C336
MEKQSAQTRSNNKPSSDLLQPHSQMQKRNVKPSCNLNASSRQTNTTSERKLCPNYNDSLSQKEFAEVKTKSNNRVDSVPTKNQPANTKFNLQPSHKGGQPGPEDQYLNVKSRGKLLCSNRERQKFTGYHHVQKKAPVKRRIESDDEEDDMSDFIDDTPVGEEEDYSSIIREIFGYDRRKYIDDDFDDSNMEASYAEVMKEEKRSARIGLMEDLEDMRKEAEEKKRKKQLKMKKETKR